MVIGRYERESCAACEPIIARDTSHRPKDQRIGAQVERTGRKNGARDAFDISLSLGRAKNVRRQSVRTQTGKTSGILSLSFGQARRNATERERERAERRGANKNGHEKRRWYLGASRMVGNRDRCAAARVCACLCVCEEERVRAKRRAPTFPR